MRVQDLMTTNVLSAGPDDTMNEAARAMWERDCGSIPVLDADGCVLGMITDRDICMAAYTTNRPLDQLRIRDAMSRKVHAARPGDSLANAEKLMWEKQIRRLPVVDGDNRLIGLITLNDIVRKFQPSFGGLGNGLTSEAVALTLAAISEPHHEVGSRV